MTLQPFSKSRKGKVLALSMGQGLTAVVGLLSTVVLARILDKTEYATFRQTFLTYQFAAPIMGLGIAQAIYYFLPGEKERIRGCVMDAISVMICMGCLFSLFILLGGNELLAKRFSNPMLADSLLYLVPFPPVHRSGRYSWSVSEWFDPPFVSDSTSKSQQFTKQDLIPAPPGSLSDSTILHN